MIAQIHSPATVRSGKAETLGLRRTDLESAIVSAMESADGAPMQWGVDDCALWAANTITPTLGYDPAAKVRGRYTTRRGAARVTGRSGLLGALRAIARHHHWKRIDPAQAQAGDVGLIWTAYDSKSVLATVVCRARGWFVGRNEMGFSAVAADKVTVAWSVLPDALADSVPLAPVRYVPPAMGGLRLPEARHEPISTAIGLSALISSTFAISATAGAAIGGAIVSTSVSQGVAIR